MHLLYTSLVCPHLDYASNIWNPYLLEDMRTIEKLQRRATKLIPSLKQCTYQERLSALNLPSLQYRRLRMDLIMTYKILQGTVHLRKDHFFIMNTNPTRTNGLKIYKHHCNIKPLEGIVFHRESSTTGTDYPLKLSLHQTYYHSKLN